MKRGVLARRLAAAGLRLLKTQPDAQPARRLMQGH